MSLALVEDIKRTRRKKKLRRLWSLFYRDLRKIERKHIDRFDASAVKRRDANGARKNKIESNQ